MKFQRLLIRNFSAELVRVSKEIGRALKCSSDDSTLDFNPRRLANVARPRIIKHELLPQSDFKLAEG